MDLVNGYRLAHDKQALMTSEYTCGMAIIRAGEIQTDWSHDGFKKHAEDNWMFEGENLAKDFDNEVDMVDAWIASPSHKKNMDEEYYNFGCVRCVGMRCAHYFSE
jgi:uncharacterized protein YkwD